jgi:hypothetical protein
MGIPEGMKVLCGGEYETNIIYDILEPAPSYSFQSHIGGVKQWDCNFGKCWWIL